MAGVLLLTVSVLFIYSVFHLNVREALGWAAGFCIGLSAVTAIAAGYRPSSRDVASFALFAIAAAAIAAWFAEAASIRNGGPSLLYAEGTDQLGYAHVADWIREHRPQIQPRADPAVPYESMPNIVFELDPRIGAFTLVAIVGSLRGLPSTFAYDPTCALLLAAAALGVAAVFARSLWALALLSAGLAVAHWYDFTRMGFLGKALAYPSSLFLVGLLFAMRGNYTPWRLLMLCGIAIGSALTLSGYVTGLMLTVIGFTAVGLEVLRTRRFDVDEFAVVCLLTATAVAASGFLVRPYVQGFPSTTFGPMDTLVRSLDIESWLMIQAVPGSTKIVLMGLVLGIAGTLSVAAYASGNIPAAALLVAPPALLGALLLLGGYSVVFQLTGFLYAASLCGVILLMSHFSFNGRRIFAIACGAGTIALILVRIPRFVVVAGRYTDPGIIAQYSHTLAELDVIASASDGRTVLVDTADDRNLPLVALVELGRRNVDLQWSAGAWYVVAGGWRGWEAPSYARPPDLRLVAADRAGDGPALRTGRFALIEGAARNEPSGGR
jgi:hypothetical protein